MKNNLDSKIHSVEKVLSENKDKLTQEIMTTVEASLTEARDALASDDGDRMKSSMEKLEKDSL